MEDIRKVVRAIWFVPHFYLAPYADRACLGDMVYFHTLGREVVVLNSATMAHDLLDKRSAKYSYRPFFAMASEVIGWVRILTLLMTATSTHISSEMGPADHGLRREVEAAPQIPSAILS